MRWERLLARTGFREYHDPFTGRGMGARAFACQAVAVSCRRWLDGLPAALS